MTDHPLDDLAAYALGVLDPDETARVDAHLTSCASCRSEARAFADTAWTIAESQGRDAPSHVRAAIVARARADGAAVGPIRARSAPDRVERILDDLFGGLGRAEHPIERSEDRAAMAVVQLPERRRVAARDPSHERSIDISLVAGYDIGPRNG